ncbi:O-antigen ligase family protein [Patescibacteria group bacterium]|nr:O-antigen ligase family protein [Patescibacteria group bacterium]
MSQKPMLKLLKWLDNSYKYIVAAIILAIPLYPKFPSVRVPGTYVSVRLEDFLLLAVVFFWLVLNASKLKKFAKDKIAMAIAIFLLVGLVSLISAIFITQSVIPHLGLLHWLRRIEYLALFFVGLTAIRDKKTLDFYLKLLGITIIAAFVYGLGQKYLTWPVIITQNLEYSKGIALRWIPGSHINSTFAGHYDLATYLVLLLPIFVSLLFVVRRIRSRVFLLVVVLSGLWLLINAISRISIVSYMVGVTLSLFLLKRYKAIPLVIVVSLVFFSFSSDLLSRYVRIIDVGRRQIDRIFYNFPSTAAYAQSEEMVSQRRIKEVILTPTPVPVFEDRSTSIRLNVEWPRALRALAKNPLLGTGYSSITLATDNDYLRLLGETGILGFFAFFLIFARVAKHFKRAFGIIRKDVNRVSSAFIAGVIGALPGLFVNTIFIDIFEASKFATIFWLVIGFSVAVIKLRSNE